MSKISLAGISALALVTLIANVARAEDVAGKVILIKDNPNPSRRFIKVLSTAPPPGVELSEADDPGTNGAALHVYSASDDFCVLLPPGAEWTNTGTKWKYKGAATKNIALVKDGRLLVKIKHSATVPITYTLNEGTQGNVNAQVQFGTGTRYCMRCPGNKKDDTGKFLGRLCAQVPCDAEPSTCDPLGTTSTTSSTTSTSTTSTTSTTAGLELKGVLPLTTGRFNYNLALGLPGANTACNTLFAGTHACTYAELQTAEGSSDLDGIKDTTNATVNSFWAIDGAQPVGLQCIDDTLGGSFFNWEYQTAHTGTFGQRVDLTNATGVLGPLLSGAGDNVFCVGTSWVGCCQ